METILFLCNVKNRQITSEINEQISLGKYYKTSWSCGNSQFIEVGDRAYFTRSGNINSNEPTGFIAAGYVIPAPENQQLKLLDKYKYSNLSAAYIHDDDGCFYVRIKIDSVVDFDFPLEQRYLKKLSLFQGVNFNFGGGGCRFNSNAAPSLDSEWDKHSLQQQREKKGRRLVDVFVEKGDDLKKNKEYQAAIDKYNLALEVDLKSVKAIERIKTCKSILKRLSQKEVTESRVEQKLEEPLEKKELLLATKKLDQENFFSSKTDAEAREKNYVSIARRQGQSKFRQELLTAYSGKCAITDFDAEAALEAAHIIPYIETENNHPSNGLLLRADLHTLFDLNLIAINPQTMRVHISPILKKTEYRTIEGKELRVPKDETYLPNQQFLKQRFEQCKW